MYTVYISVEKNPEVFEMYKKLWGSRGINGIMVDTMADSIVVELDMTL